MKNTDTHRRGIAFAVSTKGLDISTHVHLCLRDDINYSLIIFIQRTLPPVSCRTEHNGTRGGADRAGIALLTYSSYRRFLTKDRCYA